MKISGNVNRYKLLIKAPDSKGLVYKISKLIYENNLNIEQQNEFVDNNLNMFYIRTQFIGNCDIEKINSDLKNVIPNYHFISITPYDKKNIIVFVTKESHIIGNLLIKHQSCELDANILAVIGNHDNLESLVQKFDIPFHYISHKDINKQQYEEQILQTLEKYKNIDYILLAKYMRILSNDFINKYEHKIINIHHSFLPAFIGKEPYAQAFERGVKIIGATAHYATKDLDEGAIINQDIVKIDHTYNIQMLKEYGKNIETNVFLNAIKLLFNDRVFIHNNKTIIL